MVRMATAPSRRTSSMAASESPRRVRRKPAAWCPRPSLTLHRRATYSCAGVVLNPFSYEFHEDPYPTYRWLRDHAPIYHNEALNFWALSRHSDVLAASLDWETYSSAHGTTLERVDPAYFAARPIMIFLDPPRHDRLPKLVR